MEPYEIIKYPLSTEKAVRDMESTNTILLAVARDATKAKIKWAVEKAFGVKVVKVRTVVGPDNEKRAFIKLSAETPAIDITTKLGLA